MRSKNLGATTRKVTSIGLGLAALGRPGYINVGHAQDLAGRLDIETMEAHCHRMLDAAWEAGIRYFDGARSYGRAESFLGSWLQARRHLPGTVTVGSKWGYTYTAGWAVDAPVHEVKDHSLANLERQWKETRSRVNGWLDVYQIHSATQASGVLQDRAVLNRLARLKQEQDILIGLSLSGPEQGDTLDQARTITVDGRRLFDTVQATWNLLEPSSSAALARAHEAGMGVILKEVLANGRLTPRNEESQFAHKREILRNAAHRLETTLDSLAMTAALNRPWADVVLSGATTFDQLNANVGALSVAWDDAAEEMLLRIAEPPETYWHTRSRLPWN